MFTEKSIFILIVNAASIVILLVMALILLIATRFRGENGYVAAIIMLPNVPVYLYNMSRMVEWHEFTLFLFPVSYSFNTMLMPLLWLFTLRNFNPVFRFKLVYLLHFIPAILSMVLCFSLSAQERMNNIVYETMGKDSWVGDINTMILCSQLIIYFIAIFFYINKKRYYILENCSDTKYLQKEWIPRFMVLFSILFVIVMVCYVIWPRTDAWLIQILNVIAMSCLVYNAVTHSVATYIRENRETDEEIMTSNAEEMPQNAVSSFSLDIEQMRINCNRVLDYLETSQAYRRNELSLAMLSREVGIPQKVLSRSINGHLNRNFFELINELRIEEAKRKLLTLKTSDYTIDSIYEGCGFRTRSTFFLAFKKLEGKSPAQWLKKVRENS